MNIISEILIGGTTEENDIDRLFAHLEQCEPPVGMVERIMNAVAHLPLPQICQMSPWQDLEVLAIDEESVSIS